MIWKFRLVFNIYLCLSHYHYQQLDSAYKRPQSFDYCLREQVINRYTPQQWMQLHSMRLAFGPFSVANQTQFVVIVITIVIHMQLGPPSTNKSDAVGGATRTRFKRCKRLHSRRQPGAPELPPTSTVTPWQIDGRQQDRRQDREMDRQTQRQTVERDRPGTDCSCS